MVLTAAFFAVDHTGKTQGSGGVPAVARSTATGRNVPGSAVTTGQPAAAGTHVSLTALPVDTGGSNIGPLPHQLAGQPGYLNALTIPCPSNQAGDFSGTVTYALDRRYQSFHAGLHPFEPSPDQAKTRVAVFLDDQLVSSTDVQVNSAGSMDVDVFTAAKMELRVTCETPQAVQILVDPYLIPK